MTDTPLIGAVQAPDLHVMTWNIRRPMAHVSRRSHDHWSRRRALVGELLSTEQPTLLGLQEAMPEQIEFIAEVLGPAYRWIGRGRDADGGGEHCAIFADSRRVNFIDWRQLALSRTPDEVASRSWGNLLPRIVVEARCSDAATGTEFQVLNLHLDHLSRRSRHESARMLAGLAGDSDLPTVLMGDTNTGVRSEPYRLLTNDGGLNDTWLAADERLTADWSTYSHYRHPRPGRRIDWILVSDSIDVLRTGINARRFDGAAASDHEPVQAVLRLPSEVNK